MFQPANSRGPNPAIKSLLNRTNKLLMANAFLSLIMSMLRFDYNIVLSLVLLLYLENHQHDFYDFYRQVLLSNQAGISCLFFSLIDLIWLALVYDCWLFTVPAGKNEEEVFRQQLVVRWITVVCGIASCVVKIVIGIWLLGSRKAGEYAGGYVPLENIQTEPNQAGANIPPQPTQLNGPGANKTLQTPGQK